VTTFTVIAYHIVFSTKNRVPVLERDGRPDLFRYIRLPSGQRAFELPKDLWNKVNHLDVNGNFPVLLWA
jgi:hypothetical protein